MVSKSARPIDLELELAEDEYDLNRTQQALLIQGQIVQEALASQKVEIERMKAQIDSMPKRLDDALDGFLKQVQGIGPQTGIQPAQGGNWLSLLPELGKMFGLGTSTPNQAILIDLQSQFENMTAQLWKLQLRKMKDQLGIPEHVVSESVHLTGT